MDAPAPESPNRKPDVTSLAEGGHVAALDGLRGVAIAGVVLVHSAKALKYAHDTPWSHLAPWEQLSLNLMEWGSFGVDLFFALSGFLITTVLLRTKTDPHAYRNFLVRRGLRTFPLYYLVVFCWLVLAPQWPGESTEWLRKLRQHDAWFWLHASNFYYIFHNVLVRDCPTVRWMSTFWSLSVEEHFYLVWPLVVLFIPIRWLTRFCIIVAAIVALGRLGFRYAGYPDLFIYYLSFTRVDGLLLGSALAVIVANSAEDFTRRLRWSLPLILGAGLALAIPAFWTQGAPWSEVNWKGALLYAFVTLFSLGLLTQVLTSSPSSVLRRATEGRAFRALGSYSFAIYLFNKPVLEVLTPQFVRAAVALPGSPVFWVTALFALTLGLSWVIAWASWHLIEKRFLALKRFFQCSRQAKASLGLSTQGPASAS